MIKKTLTIALSLLTVAAFAFATDITGHWTGKVNDQFDVAYDFKVDGEKLTGSTTGPDGNAVPITDGMIKGDDLSFTVSIMDNPTKMTGKVKGDLITLTFKINDNDVSLDLKKTK